MSAKGALDSIGYRHVHAHSYALKCHAVGHCRRPCSAGHVWGLLLDVLLLLLQVSLVSDFVHMRGLHKDTCAHNTLKSIPMQSICSL